MKQDSYLRYWKVQTVLTSKCHKTVPTLQYQNRTFIQSTMGRPPPALFNRGVSYDIGHTHPEKKIKNNFK